MLRDIVEIVTESPAVLTFGIDLVRDRFATTWTHRAGSGKVRADGRKAPQIDASVECPL